ncbi:MAG: hypothetical protein IID44_00405 [Planctomycetes bacterium]|nr:hypothetical protein [Planctomycetota bacterium]
MATLDAIDTIHPFSNQHDGSNAAVDGNDNVYQSGLTRFDFPGATAAAGKVWTTGYSNGSLVSNGSYGNIYVHGQSQG